MNHRQRIETCLSGGKPDHTPISFWRHFPVDDQDPVSLADAVVEFQSIYDLDFVKVTPSSTACVAGWGTQDEWGGETEGTRGYTQFGVKKAEDWSNLPILSPDSKYLADQQTCLRLVTRKLIQTVPVIHTIFSPLSQVKKLVGEENFYLHLRKYPDLLTVGLETITETTIRFIRSIRETGISGIFFAVQHAQYGLLSETEFLEFGKKYDLKVLDAVRDFWLNVTHIHGNHIMFDLVKDYPVQIFNWHDQETEPSLKAAQMQIEEAVCGGLHRLDTLLLGDPEKVRNSACEAIQQNIGGKFVLGTGCVLPVTTPRANIMAAIHAARMVPCV